MLQYFRFSYQNQYFASKFPLTKNCKHFYWSPKKCCLISIGFFPFHFSKPLKKINCYHICSFHHSRQDRSTKEAFPSWGSKVLMPMFCTASSSLESSGKAWEELIYPMPVFSSALLTLLATHLGYWHKVSHSTVTLYIRVPYNFKCQKTNKANAEPISDVIILGVWSW